MSTETPATSKRQAEPGMGPPSPGSPAQPDLTSAKAWDEARFQRDHAIGVKVWKARGYSRYSQGDAGVKELRMVDPGYRRVGAGVIRFRTRSPGLAIPRRPLPGTAETPAPLAELRPDKPLTMWTRFHAHDLSPCSRDHEHHVNDEACGWFHEHDRENPHTPGRKSDPGAHRHPNLAKYVFVKSERVERLSLRGSDLSGVGTFAEQYGQLQCRVAALSETLGGSIRGLWDRAVLEGRLRDTGLRRTPLPKRPKGVTNSERALGIVRIAGARFEVLSTLRKAGTSEAMRVDINPLAISLLTSAERLYFGMEGCIKADAMLTAILATGERASVVSVPSVTLWPKDAGYHDGDLRAVAQLAGDRELALVIDADWSNFEKNDGAVLVQAATLQDRLRRLGVRRITIVAPPATYRRKLTKGVDDYLAAGGRLDHLRVIAQRDTSALVDAARRAHQPGVVAFDTTGRVAHELGIRANPRTATALATGLQLARAIQDPEPRKRPTGAAAPVGLAEVYGYDQQAAIRRAERTTPVLRRAGIRVELSKSFPGAPPPATRFIIPTALVDVPKDIGPLGKVGIPEVGNPDFGLDIVCQYCSKPIAGAMRASAKYHPSCKLRARRQRRHEATP